MFGKKSSKKGVFAALAFGALAVSTAFAANVPNVFAADAADTHYQTNTPHITIEPAESSAKPGRYPTRFEAVQVFKADVDLSKAQTASNIKWGDSIDTSKIYENLKKSEANIGDISETWGTDALPDGLKGELADYSGQTTLGGLFKAYCEKQLGCSADGSDIAEGKVSARDVAVFLSYFGWGTDNTKENTAFPAESPYTNSDVARAFTAVAKESLVDPRDNEGNKNVPGANKWTSYGLKEDVSSNENVTDHLAETDASMDGVAWVCDSINGTVSEGLPTGYYLILDNFEAANKNEALSENLLQLVDNDGIVIKMKSDIPQLDKKILVGTTEERVADSVAVTDTVHYMLQGTLPENVNSYDTYKMVFHDVAGAGISLDEGSVRVFVGASETEGLDAIEALPEVNVTGTEPETDNSQPSVKIDGQNLTVKLPNIFSMSAKSTELGGIDAKKSIFVTYTATINDDAVTGSTADESLANTATLDFSNDPNWVGVAGSEPIGKTPEKETQLYTYGLDVHKHENTIIGANQAGAGMGLLKAKNDSPKDGAVEDAQITDKDRPNNDEQIALFTKDSEGQYTFAGWTSVTDNMFDKHGQIKETVNIDLGKGKGAQDYYTYGVTQEDGIVHFDGLDEGCYTVFEAFTPSGFDTMNPYSFEYDADEQPSASTLTVYANTDDTSTHSFQKQSPQPTDAGRGVLDVANIRGVDLPSTGGIGTIIFYTAGAALILGGIAYTIARRKAEDMA